MFPHFTRYQRQDILSLFFIYLKNSIYLLAVTKNQFKAARLLLKSGANSNVPGPEGQTPIIDGVLNNNTKVHFIFVLKLKITDLIVN